MIQSRGERTADNLAPTIQGRRRLWPTLRCMWQVGVAGISVGACSPIQEGGGRAPAQLGWLAFDRLEAGDTLIGVAESGMRPLLWLLIRPGPRLALGSMDGRVIRVWNAPATYFRTPDGGGIRVVGDSAMLTDPRESKVSYYWLNAPDPATQWYWFPPPADEDGPGIPVWMSPRGALVLHVPNQGTAVPTWQVKWYDSSLVDLGRPVIDRHRAPSPMEVSIGGRQLQLARPLLDVGPILALASDGRYAGTVVQSSFQGSTGVVVVSLFDRYGTLLWNLPVAVNAVPASKDTVEVAIGERARHLSRVPGIDSSEAHRILASKFEAPQHLPAIARALVCRDERVILLIAGTDSASTHSWVLVGPHAAPLTLSVSPRSRVAECGNRTAYVLDSERPHSVFRLTLP